ncbi:MAG TPA: hypothetical protein VJQ52_18015 [Steroidobacteraceae bacterium]|nr:hypothetical protein [Steroidobacteraceae bacterium]
MHTRLLQAFAAVALLGASPASSAASDDPLVVHEWGTFTTVQAADGEQLWWTPPASLDLPDFVYRSRMSGNTSSQPVFHPKDLRALVRMETPVIYFYSRRERVVDVSVLFRGGIVTEWYPQGTRVESQSTPQMAAPHTRQFLVEWRGLTILPRATREMTLDKLIRSTAGEGDHYYIARETDANFLRVASAVTHRGAEYERDLFYRGLGYFQAPLAVGVDSDEQLVSLNAREAEPIQAAFLLTIRDGMMRYQQVAGAVANAASTVEIDAQPFGTLQSVRQLAMRDMSRALIDAGLYEKEARAMVNTWQDQWFAEEGTRVLYLLPRAWTERTLPLQVSPKPDRVVRVMVGRAELITPSVERELRQQVLTFSTGDADARSQAVAAVLALRLGRFLQPAITKATQGEDDQRLTEAAWQLARDAAAASAREDARSARN